MMTRVGVERIMRFAFRLAQSRPRKLLTVITKSNAQRHAMVMWDEIALQISKEFPDVAFTLVVDCGDAPGHALACLRAGVKTISMRESNDKIADIARQMGAELVRRPT